MLKASCRSIVTQPIFQYKKYRTSILPSVKSNNNVTETDGLLSMLVFSGVGWQGMTCRFPATRRCRVTPRPEHNTPQVCLSTGEGFLLFGRPRSSG